MRRSQGIYSGFVTYLKIGLPLVAIALLGTVFLVTSPDDFSDSGLSFTEADRTALGDGVKVVRSKITGTSERGDIYEFSADVIYPDAADPTFVRADRLAGHITTSKGLVIGLAASAASIDLNGETIYLTGGAHLDTSDGYTAETPSLTGNLATGTIVSERTVTANGPAGHIRAGSMRIQTNGKNSADAPENTVIWFGNGVTLTFLPPKK